MMTTTRTMMTQRRMLEKNHYRLNMVCLHRCSTITPSLTSNNPWLQSHRPCPMACFSLDTVRLNLLT